MVNSSAIENNQSRFTFGLWALAACLIEKVASSLFGIRVLTEFFRIQGDEFDPVILSFAMVKTSGVVANFILGFIAVCLIFKNASRLTYYVSFAAVWLPNAIVTLVIEAMRLATDAPDFPPRPTTIYSVLDWAEYVIPTSILLFSRGVAQRFGVTNLGTVIPFDTLWNKARGRDI